MTLEELIRENSDLLPLLNEENEQVYNTENTLIALTANSRIQTILETMQGIENGKLNLNDVQALNEDDLKIMDLIFKKLRAKSIRVLDHEEKKGEIEKALVVLDKCHTLTPRDIALAVKELSESIDFEMRESATTEHGVGESNESIELKKPQSQPSQDEKLPPILVNIIVKPKHDVISYRPRNIVSKSVKRNQQVIYWCKYPFTIYFGGNSIITNSPYAHVHEIKAWLQSDYRELNDSDKKTLGSEELHVIEKAWICENALSGKHKYFVAVAVPPKDNEGNPWNEKVNHWKVIVDDPEDEVRDPDEDV